MSDSTSDAAEAVCGVGCSLAEDSDAVSPACMRACNRKAGHTVRARGSGDQHCSGQAQRKHKSTWQAPAHAAPAVDSPAARLPPKSLLPPLLARRKLLSAAASAADSAAAAAPVGAPTSDAAAPDRVRPAAAAMPSPGAAAAAACTCGGAAAGAAAPLPAAAPLAVWACAASDGDAAIAAALSSSDTAITIPTIDWAARTAAHGSSAASARTRLAALMISLQKQQIGSSARRLFVRKHCAQQTAEGVAQKCFKEMSNYIPPASQRPIRLHL